MAVIDLSTPQDLVSSSNQSRYIDIFLKFNMAASAVLDFHQYDVFPKFF